ncbi:uncharacterized protein LOC129950722 [Eupeodes corollae]|uniref:uncharacterized protein LOC129950722 n=1 Tax=Eupeodes corollae TaxID=290404 RepID=UPI0024936338|nr:uncharacterized protein LOC129950722 [Eupeodes corollae]
MGDPPPEIKNLAKVVDPHLNGGQLISYSSRYLTKPGDNYGSLMLSISANIRRIDGTIEELPLVAKLPPLTSEIFWNIFNPEVTSLRENAIYENVSQSLLQLQFDKGIPESEIVDIFAKSYGCRISLNPNATTLDRDAVLVLENLQNNGYRAGKRQVMFDYNRIRMVLKYVAKYHALPIALRKLRPGEFDDIIRHKFARYDINGHMDPQICDIFKKQMMEEVGIALNGDVKAFDQVNELDLLYRKYMSQSEACEDGLFTTIAHYDLWINNVMILYDEDGKPSKLKIVDFQIAQYESLMHDIVFLLLTSVETNVIFEHFDNLLKYYYAEFIECLEKLSVNTEDYSYCKFIEELHQIAPIQIPHALHMSRVLLADDKNLPSDIKDCDTDTFNSPASEALLQKLRDIVKISQKFGFFCHTLHCRVLKKKKKLSVADKIPEILNLAQVVEPFLRGQKLISFTSKYLTKPGENYGSIMLAICAKLQNSDGSYKKLPLIAKLPPLSSKELWNLFKPEVTSLRENAIYLDLSPSIRQLQIDSGIAENELQNSIVMLFWCWRISDAVLITTGNRKNIFDLDHIRLVLEYLASYHAYPIALRNKQPEGFEKDILPKFESSLLFEEVQYEIRQMCKEVKLALDKDLEAITQYEKLDKSFHDHISSVGKERNLFTTIAHFDLWINNIMIRYDSTGTPDKLKIIDFQTSQYASLAHDVVFLLLSSVKTNILEENFHSLLKYYYDKFITCLENMSCDIKEYSYEK